METEQIKTFLTGELKKYIVDIDDILIVENDKRIGFFIVFQHDRKNIKKVVSMNMLSDIFCIVLGKYFSIFVNNQTDKLRLMFDKRKISISFDYYY